MLINTVTGLCYQVHFFVCASCSEGTNGLLAIGHFQTDWWAFFPERILSRLEGIWVF